MFDKPEYSTIDSKICTCSCHSTEHVMHFFACCTPIPEPYKPGEGCLHKNTFGKTIAAEVLAERLSKLKNQYVTSYITMMLNQSNTAVKEIAKIEHHKTQAYLMKLHAEDVAKRIYENPRIPDYIKSYANNVAQSKMKLATGKPYESVSVDNDKN